MKTIVLICFLFAILIAQKVSYSGHKVFRLSITTQEQAEHLRNLEDQQLIDIWSESPEGVDVRVAPEQFENFERFLYHYKVPSSVYIDDVQKLLDEEKRESEKFVPYDGSGQARDDFFKKYHTLDEIHSYMNDLANQYKNICSIVKVGDSYEKRPIYALKIKGKNTKAAIAFNGGIHAREWISPMTVLFIANELLSKYNNDKTITKMVDNIEFHIIPNSNPDGYVYTHTNQRMWRKTRKPNGGWCVGADPNRNWGFKWGTTGVSRNPCADTYPGPRAFSEPEVKAVADYLKEIENLKIFVDWHSYSQLFMRPYGYANTIPKDEPEMKRIGDACAEAMRSVHGVTYRSGRIAVIIYEASGSSSDWVYETTGAYGFAVELRDTGRYGFALPPSQIIPTGEESMAAVYVMAEAAMPK